MSTVNGELLPSQAVLMFTNILNKLDLLVTEVKCLRADNKSLRSELSQIRKCLPSMKPTPTVPPTNYAAVASSHSSAFPPVMSAPGTLGHPSSSAPSASNFNGGHGALNQQASAPLEGASMKADWEGQLYQRENANTVTTEDGFTTVMSRRRAKASSGTSKIGKVKSVPRKSTSKALFVSRLEPDTSAADVLDIIKPVLRTRVASCSKLQTKYTSYASFHMSVDDEAFELLNSPDVWPEGSLFHQFFGKLDVSRVSESLDHNGRNVYRTSGRHHLHRRATCTNARTANEAGASHHERHTRDTEL
ncbi:hypothetical protein HPB47_004854 [Ixodes persulcatus]|uniref:Uncharacterized protein n=1 Tax=Ixodes persulcatus TaxID=34615 RepID=A0AC60PFB6_IXOPE|nr:hypothetical protein HPB47_004854 [Ixodes persulcatus]